MPSLCPRLERMLLPGGCLLACSLSPLFTAETSLVGPRAHGMAGANIASTNDSSAQYYNPAAFGFYDYRLRDAENGEETEDISGNDNYHSADKNFAVDVDAGFGYRVGGEIADYLDVLSDIGTDGLSGLNDGGGLDQSEVEDLITIIDIFSDLDEPDNALFLNANAGGSLRVNNWGAGVRGFTHMIGRVEQVDTDNLGFNFVDVNALSTEIENSTTVPGGYTIQHLSSSQQTQLTTAGYTPNAITTLDYYLNQEIANGTIDPSNIDDITGILESVANATEGNQGNDIENNSTAIVLQGFSYVEAPLTYGHAINDQIAVGVNLKYMLGRVMGTGIAVFSDDNDNFDSRIRSNYEETSTFGVDVGIMARMDNFQVGIIGRNLNSPEFDGFSETIDINGSNKTFTYDDVTLDPQVSIGAAWIPWRFTTIEASLDLTENESVLSGYHTQYARIGGEISLRIVDIRAGIMSNIAEDDIGPIINAGIGLNVGPVSLALAAHSSLETATFEGEDLPSEAGASFGLAIAW